VLLALALFFPATHMQIAIGHDERSPDLGRNAATLSTESSLAASAREHDDAGIALSLQDNDISETTGNFTASPPASVEKADSTVVEISGSNRFVAWTDYTPGNAEILFKRSTDSGATWKSTVNLSNNPGNSINVAIVAFGSKVYAVWTQYNNANTLGDVFFRGSVDNGATWGPKVKLSSSGDNVGVLAQITASGSNVFVAWSESNDEIFLRRSTDNGATWKPAVNLSNASGPSTDPQITASGSNVYVVWQDFVPSNYDILFKRSTDNGATWKPTVNLSNNAGDSYLPQIAAVNSNVIVTWKDSTPGNADILFKRSTNNGASWKSTFNLSKNFGDSAYPQIAAFGSSVFVVWQQDNTPFTFTDVFFRGSVDNGATWGPKVKLSSSGDNRQSYPQVTSSGSSVFVSWSESFDEIFLRRSTDNGATWKPAVNLSNNPGPSYSAYIAASGSNVAVVWNDISPGNAEILFKRSTDNGATLKPTVNLSNNAGKSVLTQEAV